MAAKAAKDDESGILKAKASSYTMLSMSIVYWYDITRGTTFTVRLSRCKIESEGG